MKEKMIDCPYKSVCNHYEKAVMILDNISGNWRTANELQLRTELSLGYIYRILKKLIKLQTVEKKGRIIPLPSKSKFVGTNVKKISEYKAIKRSLIARNIRNLRGNINERNKT